MKFPESYNGGSVGREGNSTWKSRVKRRVEEKRDREKEREPRVKVGGRRRTARGAMATWTLPPTRCGAQQRRDSARVTSTHRDHASSG